MSELVHVHEEPMQLIRLALETGKESALAGLYELQERHEKKVAAERYADAITAFQRECPPIPKSRPVMNKDGKTVRYHFASYEDIKPVVQPHLTKHGIATSFSSPAVEKMCSIILRTQVGSHFVDHPFAFTMPNLEKLAALTHMNEAQVSGAVLSYFKRYAFISALDLTVVGEDSDCLSEFSVETISEEQVADLEGLIRRVRDSGKKVPLERVLAYISEVEGIEVKKLADVTVKAFPKLKAMLESQI